MLVATEKVVEYYFPEDKKQASAGSAQDKEEKKQGANSKASQRKSAGNTTFTTHTQEEERDNSEEEADRGSLNGDYNSDIARLKRKMKLLDLNSLDDNLSSGMMQLESPRSNRTTTLKKRRFRQLERYNFDDELEPFEGSASKSKVSGKSKNDKKGMKLNEKLLRKASATVDLISQKAKQKNMMQETVTACFVTNVIELTKDALDKIAPNQQLAVPISEEQQLMVASWGMNLRFIKPSHSFYNEVMSNWFKYLHILEQQREENNLPMEWKPIEL